MAEKVKVLETEPATAETWYANENAHNMYVSQAKGNSASKIDFEKQKSHTPFRPGKGNYGNCQYNFWCRFCGNNGHTIGDCRKRKAMKAKRKEKKNNVATGKTASATCGSNPASCKSSSTASIKSYNSCDSNVTSNPKSPKSNSPRKAELRWVLKV